MFSNPYLPTIKHWTKQKILVMGKQFSSFYSGVRDEQKSSITLPLGGVAGNLSGCEDNNVDVKINNVPEQISSLEVTWR